ncbi:interleukin-17C [Centroberyx affinis]|uniref:interleukin-17C n=1 Tax=Centroberyx affinis TaxID=166261 RepID=UPI003A5C5126
MDVTQILLFGLLFVPVLTSKFPCYEEQDLEEKAQRKLNSHYPQPPEPARLSQSQADAPVCPVELYQQSVDISDRSLSPWRYIYDTKEDRFPRTFAVAQCLCEGCIMRKEENMDYNSVPITQSRVVLKKELCEDGRTYRLVPVSESVVVGCTCVKAKTA